MKFRAIVATILVVVGLGVVYVCWQGEQAKSASSAAPVRAQQIAAAAPASSRGSSGSAVVSRQIAVSTNQTPTVRGTLPYVLTSVGPFNKPLRQAVEAMGAKTVGVLSSRQVLVEASPSVRSRLAADRRFASVSERLPAEKLEPRLAKLLEQGVDVVQVTVMSLLPADRETLRAKVLAEGGEILKGCIEGADFFKASLSGQLVADLAARGDVQWLETFQRPHLMNDRAVEPAAMNVQAVWKSAERLDGLSGEGQIVTTSDSGIDTGDLETMHEDLRDRVVDMKAAEGCDMFDSNGHGTHTAGSIVGTGAKSDGRYRGTAWGATLRVWFCGKDGGRGIYTPTTAEELFRGDTNGTEWADSYLHSASWGSDTEGRYTTDCLEYDKYVWKHPEYLPIFACGNAGDGKRTVGSPAAAKNVLTVGATLNLSEGDASETASFSSRGPCGDGRIKPDVASPGDSVTSTRSTRAAGKGDYTSMSGTSMATPLTAGAVTLIREWLTRKPEFSDPATPPTAALMKAIVTGGAKDAAVPNNDQGWGRVDLAETLYPSNRAVKLVDRIPFAQGFVTNIIITTTNKAPLDVQLVWVDYPGATGASRALVNDLDLIVESHVVGEPLVRYGNGGDEPDTLNNVESVRIADATPTTYVISVRCKNVPYDWTEGGAAALYIRGAFDPEAEVEEPDCVHLEKQDRNFMSLTRALEAVRDEGEGVEIRDWVGFYRPATLTNSCVIKAVDPAARWYVACQDSATLTVATNAMVRLNNVVFTNSTESFVTVEAGGCLEMGDYVDLGLDMYQLSVKTAQADGFRLAGSLTRRMMLQCNVATNENQVFGVYADGRSATAANAVMIVCADDIDRELRGGIGPHNTLIWKATPVPLDEASGYFVDAEGNTNASYRFERALERFAAAYGAGTASEFVIRRGGTWGLPFEVGSPLSVRGEGEVRPVVTCNGTYEPDECFFYVPADGSLTISNIVFTGYDASEVGGCSFICVDGGELTLADGAELNGIVGSTDRASGVIDLFEGHVTMLPGSAIVNCRAWGSHGYGGAIYVYSMEDPADCRLDLLGGKISKCFARNSGGAVYVCAEERYQAEVNLAGPLVIDGNDSGNSAPGRGDNITFESSYALPTFTLAKPLSGRVGVRYSSDVAAAGNRAGDAFVTVAAGMNDEELAASADCFVCDTSAGAGLQAVAAPTGDRLVWEEIVDDGTVAEADASAHVWYEGATASSNYVNLATAVAHLQPGKSRIEMYKGADAVKETLKTDLVIPNGYDVTLCTGEGKGMSALTRSGDIGVTVREGGTLTVSNILFRAGTVRYDVTKALFEVEGGSLTLTEGAVVSNIVGNASRAACAVSVKPRENGDAGGVFTMLQGSRICACTNTFNAYQLPHDSYVYSYGVGGGVYVDVGSTANLRGGEIVGCAATRGGGLFVSTNATAFVSDGMVVDGNVGLDADGKERGASNLEVEGSASLVLDGELTGGVRVTNGGIFQRGDTNVFGRVSDGWAWSADALAGSAKRFVNDVAGDTGLAMTNETETILVWSAAAPNGVYTNAGDVVYHAVGSAPKPPEYAEPLPIAFKSIVKESETVTLVITDAVQWCNYSVFATNTLEGGFTVTNGLGALIVEPLTNFQWKTAEKEISLTFPTNGTQRFWKATAAEGEIPAK